jgi:methylmalonyl-CoA/ethylmalonyl-CoA epimerase
MKDSKENQMALLTPLHVGVSVPDLDASIEWYRRMLDFELLSDCYVAQLPARIAFMAHGDFQLELFQVDGAAPLPEDRRTPNLDIRTHGVKHVAYQVADLHSLMDRLKVKGVDVAMDIFSMQGDWVAFIRDNAGNLIELIEVDGHGG